MIDNNGNRPKVVKYDYRCVRCGRLWFRAYLGPGTMISIRCPKCGCMGVLKSDDVTELVSVEMEVETV